MTLTQLSDHVWLFPFVKGVHITQPNIGIVVGKTQTVLIDCGNGAPHAERIKTAVSQHNFPPITQIIYTHHHWDHTFGAHCFDAPVIANRRGVPFLEQKKKLPWGEPFLRERWEKEPPMRDQVMEMLKSAGDWSTFFIRLPDTVFDKRFEIALEEVTLSLSHVGGIHSIDAITVQVDDVLFVGDAYYPPPTYEQKAGEAELLDLDVIDAFLSPEIDIYIDGHNKPFSRRQLQYLIRFQKMKQAAAQS